MRKCVVNKAWKGKVEGVIAESSDAPLLELQTFGISPQTSRKQL